MPEAEKRTYLIFLKILTNLGNSLTYYNLFKRIDAIRNPQPLVFLVFSGMRNKKVRCTVNSL